VERLIIDKDAKSVRLAVGLPGASGCGATKMPADRNCVRRADIIAALRRITNLAHDVRADNVLRLRCIYIPIEGSYHCFALDRRLLAETGGVGSQQPSCAHLTTWSSAGRWHMLLP
jgi:hypothetical protein